MKTIQIRSAAGPILATACLTVLCLHASADQFVQVTRPGWTSSSQCSSTGAWGDYDKDGFVDLFVAETTGNNALYHNLGNTNHWIKFQLEGTVANRTAIGAKVRVKATIGGKTIWQMREVSGGNFCQNDLRPNFGLGDATNVDLVRIEWPSGIVQEFQNVATKQFLTVTEPSRLAVQGPAQLQIRSWKGMCYELQASTNLVNWAPMCMITNLDGNLQYVDPNSSSHPRRFYRAVAK